MLSWPKPDNKKKELLIKNTQFVIKNVCGSTWNLICSKVIWSIYLCDGQQIIYIIIAFNLSNFQSPLTKKKSTSPDEKLGCVKSVKESHRFGLTSHTLNFLEKFINIVVYKHTDRFEPHSGPVNFFLEKVFMH